MKSQNFEIRKNVLKYDEVMNRQREVIYEWRQNLLDATGDDLIGEWIDKVIGDTVESVLTDEVVALRVGLGTPQQGARAVLQGQSQP